MKPAPLALAALLCFIFTVIPPCKAQRNDQPGVAAFPYEQTVPLKIVRDAVPSRPFTVVGPRGAALGLQDGTFEAWIFPWKVLSNFRITAEFTDAHLPPVEVNPHASSIEVQPDHTTITFSHEAFTVREILFAPQTAPEGAGILGFFTIQAVRPITFSFQFNPEMKRMWPAPSDAYTSAEWLQMPSGGFYALHTSFPDHAAAIAMPGAEPGILSTTQDRGKSYPAQFVLHFEPARDSNRFFPLLIFVGDTLDHTSNAAMENTINRLLHNFRSLYDGTAEYYRNFLSQHLSVETPDKNFDDAFSWAEVSIDQLKVQTIPNHDETALVAGFDRSGDTARPGFGWYFGRDALWTLYAVNAYGDFQLTRDELEFLIRRQSPEGKIMHEWSQTATIVDWKSLPFQFAAADATPLFLMAVNDYYNISNDTAFLEAHWDALKKAWDFESSHDSDRDGIYENIAGTGWVESWPPGMPHQEIYLAALDEQASIAFANLARAAEKRQISEAAETRAKRVAEQIEKEYFLPGSNFYAFSRNADGTLDPSPTIYPAVSAWDGTFELTRSTALLNRWASQEFSTDWGTRDLSPTAKFYDPVSYHQGSVWPLFTGWVSLSEYRNGRSLSGYSHLMQNADLTWAQNLGAVTEVLSGAFYHSLAVSTSHQLWSSAMVLNPALRGMFGLEWNAAESTLSVTPNLPAQWSDAKLKGLPLGQLHLNLEFHRTGSELTVRLTGNGSNTVRLLSHSLQARTADGQMHIPLPAVEVGLQHDLPLQGAVTSQMKVIDQQQSPRSLRLLLSAPADSTQEFFLRINKPRVQLKAEGADVSADSRLRVSFPSGTGYVDKAVTLSW